MLKDTSKTSKAFTAEFNDVLDCDVLNIITPDLDGMAWNKAWSYLGGFGLAGFHFEDAWFHFGHHLVDIKFTATTPILQVLLNTMARLSRKTWITCTKGGLEGIKAANTFISTATNNEDIGDALLVSRSFVFDPTSIGNNDLFEIHHQVS